MMTVNGNLILTLDYQFRRCSASVKNPINRNNIWIILAVVISATVFIILRSGHSLQLAASAAMATLMAILWLSEALPIPATSLLPMVIMPLAGIASMDTTTSFYAKPVIFLFLGGFILALGIEKSGLHRRLALLIVKAIGSNLRNVILGFMVASALLSMWISNTATVMVMLPIALAISKELISKQEMSSSSKVRTAAALMLAISYSASIGGVATPVGTPANLVYYELFGQIFPNGPEISFANWMLLGLPLTVVFLVTGWFVLVRFILPVPASRMPSDLIRERLSELGTASRDEKLSGIVFLIVALAWVTGSRISIGAFTFPGWRSIEFLKGLDDASIAIAGAISLFFIPSSEGVRGRLMDWESTKSLPWGVLLLFGGGFALAGAFESSGLSGLIGDAFLALQSLPPYIMLLLVCAVMTTLTEFTSNTATATLVLPILAKASVVMGYDPRFLMMAATFSCSCAFMMPVGSPTQAIVYGTGQLSLRQMAKAGIWFNLMGMILISTVIWFLGQYLGYSPDMLPGWAM